MDVELLALVLLTGRVIAIGFILWVIARQVWLFRNYSVPEHAEIIRKVLFTLSVIMLISNFIPATIDYAALTNQVTRTAEVGQVGVIYTLSNMVTSLASALTVFYLYLQAKKIIQDQ